MKEGENMSKKLSMSFVTSLGGTSLLSMDAPKDGLTEPEVRTTMNLIVEKNLFNPPTGDITSIKAAKVVTTLTETII